MGTTEPWRTALGSTQGACADHPPAGLGEPIIRGPFSVSAPFRHDLDPAHIDPSSAPQAFALLGQALINTPLNNACHGHIFDGRVWADPLLAARCRGTRENLFFAGFPFICL